MKSTLSIRNITSLAISVSFAFLLATRASAQTVSYLTNFAKDNNIFTNLNEEFPHTDNGTGVPGSRTGTPNARFFFDPAPTAVEIAGYAPDYVSGSNSANNHVGFRLTSDAAGHDFASFDTAGVTVPVRADKVQIVYALVGAYNGQTISAKFTGANGATQTFSDIYIPDFNGGSINSTDATVNDQTVFQVLDVGAGGSGNSTTGAYNHYSLTEVRFPLSPNLANQELISVTFTANGYEGLLLGVTAVSGVTAPTVVLTSPPNQITVVAGETIPLTASVTDPGGVLASVQFLVNGQVIATTGTTAPFAAMETIPSTGTYVLKAVSTDVLGRKSTSSVTVNAVAADPLNPPPTTSLLTPLAGLNLAAGTTLTLTAAADAPTAGLDHVVVYIDGVAVATFDGQGNPVNSTHGGSPERQDASGTPVGNTFSTAYTLPGVDKLLNMIVVAFDKLGQASVSGVSSVHATVTSDKAPQVAISNVAATADVAVGSTNTVDVTASDPDMTAMTAVRRPGFVQQDSSLDGALAKLSFYINGALADLLSAPPSTTSFSFDPPASGKYVLHSVATDGSGLSTISDPVIVTATVPTVTAVVAGDGVAVERSGQKGKVFIERTGDTSLPLTIFYKVKGSAVADVDYKALPGMVMIPSGASKAKIKIKPLDDTALNGTLKAKVKLLPSTDGSYKVGDPAVAKIKIIGHD